MTTKFTTDGCSGGMSFAWWLVTESLPPWEGCCIEHDEAYWEGGSKKQRALADARLYECVAKGGNPVMAYLMWISVRFGGHWIFPFSWRWGYRHPWPRRYTR